MEGDLAALLVTSKVSLTGSYSYTVNFAHGLQQGPHLKDDYQGGGGERAFCTSSGQAIWASQSPVQHKGCLGNFPLLHCPPSCVSLLSCHQFHYNTLLELVFSSFQLYCYLSKLFTCQKYDCASEPRIAFVTSHSAWAPSGALNGLHPGSSWTVSWAEMINLRSFLPLLLHTGLNYTTLSMM